MKKMFTFAWLFLFIAVAVEAGSIPQWKKNKIEEMNKFETIKFKSGDNKINESFSWMPGFFVKDYDHYNFKVLEKATDNVAWLAGGSYSGSPKAGSIYGFIVDFAGQQPVTKSFKYADGYLGGLGGLAAFDASIAVMGLYTGELVRTTNGGQSWDTVHVYNNPDSAFIDGVKRIPGTDTVYAFGDADSKGVFVGISVNKGLTWTRLTVGPKGSKSTWWGYAGYNQCLATVPGKVWYTAYSYAVPQDSILISSSSNGGVTWDETSVFLKPDVATNYYFRSINFKDANVGYGVSRRSVLSTSSDNDNWYHKTTDGGKTWSDTISMEPGALHKTQKVYSVQSIPGSNWVLAVGFSSLTGSKSWLSKNGGSTFEVIKTPGVTNLTNFIALDTNKIIVGGYKQLMTKVPLSNSNLVVFEVNMNIQKNLKKFDPTKDSVYVRGNFMPGAWWESNAFKLADADGDLIYSGAYNMTTVPTKIAYKFIEIGPSTGGGSRWEEGMGDRIDTIPYAPLKLKTVYFENDSLSIFFNNDITFKVNMSYEMIKGKFNKATDSVVVRGDFNGWGGKKTLLSDADGDSIYTGTYNITSTPKFRFKFVKIQPTGEGWESSPDRWASGMTGPTTSLPLAWFNDAPNGVTFAVNMNIQKNLKKFDPTKDSVYVRGNFMPGAWWESNAFKLSDPDGDLIYSGIYYMPTLPLKIAYKFIEIGPSTGGGSRWEEGMGDRKDSIVTGPYKIPTVYFENDSLSIFFNNNITFKVNMSYEMIKGKFNKATDSVVVRGDFNGWGGKKTLLSDADGDSIYAGTYNITSTPKFRFKFVKIQPTGEGWESSPDRWASGMTGPTTSLPLAWFNDAPNGVTFVVNMNQQLKAKKFDPKKDSVFVRGNFMPGEWWASNAFKLSDPDGDLFYSGIYYMPKLPLKIGYKFVQRGVTFPGDRWEEGIPDRTDSIVTGPYKIPAVYFENDSTSVYFDNNVTFSVNMKIQIKKSKFTKASDSVVVRGDFNGWGGKNTLLKDADGDSIYTGTYNIPSTKKFRFKFVTIAATGDGWESSPDRVAENLTGPTTVLPNYFFNNDSVIVNIVNVNWRVNMRVKLAEGAFKPASGHKVFVRGEMNGWSESDELLDADNDSVFSKKIAVDEGKEYKFKYMMKAGSDVWEGGSDKVYKVPVGGGDVPLLYFDGDSLVSKPTTGTIMYRVNLSAYEKAGWFKRTEGDSMQINGGFNSWSGTSLTRKSGTEIYELARTYNGFTYDQEDFKFFMKFNPTTVKARFPEYNEDTKSGFHYEHPADRGDGNRVFNYGNGGNIQTPVYMISDIDERGLISSGDTVTVKFTVDMTPALTHSIPFKPATDTVKIVFFDDLWRSVSKVPKSIVLQKIGANYFGQVNVIGKSHYNLLYQINYGTVTEGGGLGVQNPYRSRFITPLSANKFPRIYSTPVDVFKANAPLFGEKNPYAMGVIDQTVNFIPETYSLGQNYPNPFNPSTKIKYAIPQESIVRIRVFNMLGQVVATVIDTKQSAGEYVATFDATHLGSGAYFYSLEAGSFKSIKKMLLLK